MSPARSKTAGIADIAAQPNIYRLERQFSSQKDLNVRGR